MQIRIEEPVIGGIVVGFRRSDGWGQVIQAPNQDHAAMLVSALKDAFEQGKKASQKEFRAALGME